MPTRSIDWHEKFGSTAADSPSKPAARSWTSRGRSGLSHNCTFLFKSVQSCSFLSVGKSDEKAEGRRRREPNRLTMQCGKVFSNGTNLSKKVGDQRSFSIQRSRNPASVYRFPPALLGPKTPRGNLLRVGRNSSICMMRISAWLRQLDCQQPIRMYPPAARPLHPGKTPVWSTKPRDYEHVHAVDGGYFDNSGLCALAEWLDEGLEERDRSYPRDPAHREEILVLQIRGFPSGEKTTFKLKRGWFYQLYAPVATLLGVWTSGQENTTTTELALLEAKWKCRGIDIRTIIFEPNNTVYQQPNGKTADIPLSWHLRAVDKQRIQQAWDDDAIRRQCEEVVNFVEPPHRVAGSECMQSSAAADCCVSEHPSLFSGALARARNGQ